MDNIDFNKNFDKDNKIQHEIFSFIFSKKWEELFNFIKKHKDFDYNIKDTSGISLLEYIVTSNNEKILKILFERNIKIDIVDDSNKSILHDIIKYSKNNILTYFIQANNKFTGFNILDIRDDNGEIPIFYCVKYKNFNAFSQIIKHKFNYYNKNNKGENLLFYCLNNKEIKMFNIFFDYYSEITDTNINGETIFHLIVRQKEYEFFYTIYNKYKHTELFVNAINITECLYNFSILHYASINNDKEFFDIFNKNKLFQVLNCNLQDISGNTFYHYFIKNIINKNNQDSQNIIFINNIITGMSFNIDIYNIDGDTSCNILCDSIQLIDFDYMYPIIKFIITESDINIQNLKGNCPFFNLIKNNYWNKLKNILVYKKIDIFIIAENCETVFDFIQDKHMDDFIDFITNSYFYQLSKSANWTDSWDKKCSVISDDFIRNKIYVNKDPKYQSFKNMNISNKDLRDSCYEFIHKKIHDYIKIFLLNKKDKLLSYPSNKKPLKLIPNYPSIVINTFYGYTIDILCGLFYLHDKFKNKKNYYIDSSISLINYEKEIINCNFTEGISSKKICEIKGFEIHWKHFNFILSSYDNTLIYEKLQFIISLKHKYKYYIIPLAIELYCNNKFYSHANFIIFDLTNLTCHRFEPHGSDYPYKLNYKPQKLDDAIFNFIENLNLKIKYYSPKTYLPKIGFQQREIYENENTYVGDPDGFCASWCVWWCDILISNPEINIKKLQKYLLIEITNQKLSYHVLIRNFSFFITKIRDSLLNKINININDWSNDTINKDKIYELNNILINKIKSYY